MNIGVIGLGKLGCSMFAAFAASGNNVFGYDINPKTRQKLKDKIKPVSETDLQKELDIGFDNYQIMDDPTQVIEKSDVIYVIVPTPSLEDGTFDIQYLENVLDGIYEVRMDCGDKLLVITSTVLPGDTRSKLISLVRNKKNNFSNIRFCYSPEFIALGSVLNDLKNPDFLLIGEEYPNSAQNHLNAMMTIINDKNIPVKTMSIESAEMAKISINSYITSKISFANAIGLTSESIDNCSPTDVLNAIGADTRIGNKYLSKGLGFGGPCFPRDNRAIQQVINKTVGLNYRLPIDNEKFNNGLPDFYSKKIQKLCLEKNISEVLIVGLSYKDGSYLLEESQSFAIALNLKKLFKVFYFDPDITKSVELSEFECFNEKSKVKDKLLLLNCSRDSKKLVNVEEILNQKEINFVLLDIWK